MDKPRRLALKILDGLSRNPAAGVLSLDSIFLRESDLTARDRAFIIHLVLGVSRWRLRLDWVIAQTADFPFKKIKPDVLNILRLALFQILFLDRIPDSAAVNEAVKQIKAGKTHHLASFVNGILRNICRQKEKIAFPDREKDPVQYLSVFYSFPRWLVQYWIDQWGPAFTEGLLAAENRPSILTLRTNTLKTGREKLMEIFREEGIACEPTPYSPEGVLLADFRGRVSDLVGFREGWFQVQDQAAQIVSHLLGPRSGERVLDVCAGRGGKTSHLSQLMGGEVPVIALDVNHERLVGLRKNDRRLGIHSTFTVAADAGEDLGCLFKHGFERILVDAPCTGLGTLSRHPDGKWNKGAGDFVRLSRVQRKILNQTSKLLTRGGHMLYVTCTLSKEENEDVVQGFLQDHRDIELTDLRAHGPEWARDLMDEQGCFRTYPHVHQMGGFFAALFMKGEDTSWGK